MSGIIITLFSLRILSALSVVGEFAPSTITFAFIFSALLDVITPPTAAGINISQSSSRISSSSLSAPSNPSTDLFFAIYLNSSGIFIPSLL